MVCTHVHSCVLMCNPVNELMCVYACCCVSHVSIVHKCAPTRIDVCLRMKKLWTSNNHTHFLDVVKQLNAHCCVPMCIDR